ncbi:extracellular solute-binding protein [Uliginosibacterium flavum]|uniref:Extracellular solute-binding protein n=1 Tax=Uliginosibacterium flavum TaxID=1396831 RepID=A0ABV2TKF6_9RHOO
MYRLLLALLLLPALLPPAWAAHAYAQFGDIKYKPGFQHFEWVNPAAPKGGEITLVAPTTSSQYDKYNPFTLKGTSPPGLGDLVFETLLTGTLDEPTTAYGLLAEDVSVAADKRSATFRLNAKARFQNGSPVLAKDVKYSFERLTSKEAHPGYANMLADVKSATVLSERSIRFDFKQGSAELPLIVGGLPVFSHSWGAGKKFDEVIMDKPIASGPYRIAAETFGRDISYERNPDYWAKDLPVRRGQYNFDHINYRIYSDEVVQTEAFKAGEFDYIQVFIARQWARAYVGPKFDSGEIIKRRLPSRNSSDFQGFLFNTRRDKFKDVRVREALEATMDYEWMNRQLFYGSYTRVQGYFPGGDFEAQGLPGPDELALLKPLRSKLAQAVFTQPVPLPPSTDAPASLRDNLRQARDLLAEAGWTYREGALRNTKGEPFTIEFLETQSQGGSFGRVLTPMFKNLEKLGIQASIRIIDSAIMQKRMDVFDFDILTTRIPGREAPGSELRDRFSSQAAVTEGSSNLAGVKDPAVDALLDKTLAATTRPQLVAALRALDRVLRFGHYSLPQWYSNSFRVAWRSGKFGQPEVMPAYYQPEVWLTASWWALPKKD